MELYELVVIITNPLLAISLYKINNTLYCNLLSNKFIEKLSYLAYFIITSATFYFINIPNVLIVVNIISFFLISLNYEGNFTIKIINAVIICSIMAIVEIATAVLFDFRIINTSVINESAPVIAVLIVKIVIVSFSFNYSLSKKQPSNAIIISKKDCLSIMCVLLGTLYLFIKSLNVLEYEIIDIIVSSFIVLLINVIIILILASIYKSFSAIREHDIMNEQNKSYEKQLNLIKKSTNDILSLKHDAKNHYLVLRELSLNNQNTELIAYINKIISVSDKTCLLSNSNNFKIDSIINFKLGEISDSNIDILVDIKVPKQLNISGYDITIILGNLLDNAITALMAPHENKHLCVKIKYSKGNLLIYIDNTFNGLIKKNNNGKLLTMKKNVDNHGLGILNIEEALIKYNGNMEITNSETLFSVAMWIPNIDIKIDV